MSCPTTCPPDAAALMRAVLARPTDPLARLVLADWLEETGSPSNIAWANFLRLTHADLAPPPNELARAAAGIRARLTVPARFFLKRCGDLLSILPPGNISVWLTGFQPHRSVVELVPESIARTNRVLPLGFTPKGLVLAAAGPLWPGVRELIVWAVNRDVVLVGAPANELSDAIGRVFGRIGTGPGDTPPWPLPAAP